MWRLAASMVSIERTTAPKTTWKNTGHVWVQCSLQEPWLMWWRPLSSQPDLICSLMDLGFCQQKNKNKWTNKQIKNLSLQIAQDSSSLRVKVLEKQRGGRYKSNTCKFLRTNVLKLQTWKEVRFSSYMSRLPAILIHNPAPVLSFMRSSIHCFVFLLPVCTLNTILELGPIFFAYVIFLWDLYYTHTSSSFHPLQTVKPVHWVKQRFHAEETNRLAEDPPTAVFCIPANRNLIVEA